jgi:hypothetical protein
MASASVNGGGESKMKAASRQLARIGGKASRRRRVKAGGIGWHHQTANVASA